MSGAISEDSSTYRRPWYWMLVLAAIVLIAVGIVVQNARSRNSAARAQFAAAMTLRLDRVKDRVNEYFADAAQLANTAARTSEDLPADEELVVKLLRTAFLARHDTVIYGYGIFYKPFWFDPKTRFVDFYVHAGRRRYNTTDEVVQGVTVVRSHESGADPRGDYTVFDWYKDAAARPGKVMYDGPYVENRRSFITASKAFFVHGKLAGVVAVDALTDDFRGMLARPTVRGDYDWLDLPGPHSAYLVGTSPLPNGTGNLELQTHVTYATSAVLHLASDTTPLRAAEERNNIIAGIAIVVVLGLGAIVAMGLLQRWNAEELQRSLKLQRSKLEQELQTQALVESELRRIAFIDDLTGLPNRAAFMDSVAGLLRDDGSPGHAVFLIDLDHFNITNETLGHNAGDELLRVIASRLRGAIGGDALVARMGGDEYVVLCACTGNLLHDFAAMLLRCIAEPVVLFGRTIYTHASIGIAIVEPSYSDAQEVLRDADIAMYAAKARGRARHVVFDTEMREQIARDGELETHLRRGIERGDIVPYYQPIVDLLTRRTVSFEALARWNHDGETVAAYAFVPFAEARGFVHEIDAAMVRATLAHAQAIFALFPEATIALNVSAPEVTTGDYAAELMELLRDHNIEPKRIRLEITETTMMTRADEAHETLKTLNEAGVTVVLDDFGTGYSSLAYLQRLSISGLKIDRSFVDHIDSDERSREIVRSIVALAHALGLTTIAEGVERAAQIHELSLLGVKLGQGFFFSRAVAMAELADLQIPDERAVAANLGE